MEPSIPKRLFNQFTAPDDTAAIQHLESLVGGGGKTFENQFLEFKRGRVQKVGDPWSRELSAFANTGGGVVVWGIGTNKENGVEYADTIEKVPDPLALQLPIDARIKEQIATETQHGATARISLQPPKELLQIR